MVWIWVYGRVKWCVCVCVGGVVVKDLVHGLYCCVVVVALCVGATSSEKCLTRVNSGGDGGVGVVVGDGAC